MKYSKLNFNNAIQLTDNDVLEAGVPTYELNFLLNCHLPSM